MAGASFSESPSSGLVDSESIVRKMIQSRKSFSYAPRSMVRNTNRPAALRVASPAFERGGTLLQVLCDRTHDCFKGVLCAAHVTGIVEPRALGAAMLE